MPLDKKKVKKALSSPVAFMEEFSSAVHLSLYAREEYADQLIGMVIKYPELNKKFIQNFNDLIQLARCSPLHAEKLFKKAIELSDSQVFKKDGTPSIYDWTEFKTAIKVFPSYVYRLLSSAKQNKDLFQQLVPNYWALIDILEEYPELNYLDFLLLNKKEFIRLITDAYDLKEFIAKYPNHTDEILRVYCSDQRRLSNLIERDFILAQRGQKLQKADLTLLEIETLKKQVSALEKSNKTLQKQVTTLTAALEKNSKLLNLVCSQLDIKDGATHKDYSDSFFRKP